MLSILTKMNENEPVYVQSPRPESIIRLFLIRFGYLLFVVLLVVVLSLNSKHQINEKPDVDATNCLPNISFSGIHCAFSFKVDRHVKVWEPFTVTIFYNSANNCSGRGVNMLKQNGGAVFRVQAFSVYEMVTSTSEHTVNGEYKASLLLTFPTNYMVMVMVTYVNDLAMESRFHVRPILRQLPRSPFPISVARAPSPENLARYCSKEESGSAHGRWIKCGGAISGLERCGPWQSPDFDFDRVHGYRWVPYRCQYHQYTNDEIKRCFARNRWRSIIFAGDSHMRYRAYHWVTRLYGSCHACAKTHVKMVFDKVPRIEWIFDARGTRLPLSFNNISLPHEKYIHPKVRRSKFSLPFPTDAMDGDLYLLNFGHWVLRESLDTKFMLHKLHAFATSAKYLQGLGKTVIWVNTVSLPWRTDQAVIDWRENTSPSRVYQFNQLADSIMNQYGIPVVDAFQISDGRVSATHDQTHYTKRLPGNDFGGAVENAISNAMFNRLCNNEQQL